MKKLVVAVGIVVCIAFGMPAIARTKPTIPIILKDMTSAIGELCWPALARPVKISESTLSS